VPDGDHDARTVSDVYSGQSQTDTTPSPITEAMKRAFVDNIELILSIAGLGVIFSVPALLGSNDSFWQVAAATAAGVGLLHGIIFWVLRAKQRRVRRRAIEEIREMLADVVKNQLAVIGMLLPGTEEYEGQIEHIKQSIGSISSHVDTLSEEAIVEWKTHYHEAVVNATELEPA
jgi:hypothetical protein